VFDKDTDEPRLISSWTQSEGVPLIPGKWWWTRRVGRLTAAAGLMRTAAIWSHFKSLAVRDWLVFSDRFGIPYVTGEYAPEATEADKDTLATAVSNLGSDGWAIYSDACKMVINEVKSGGASVEGVHSALTSLCDTQISKLIAGATLMTETTGQASYAIGKVHQGRSAGLKEGDAEWLAQSFESCIGRPFVHFNGLDARAPRLKMHLALDVSVLEQVKIASVCANELGMALDEDQIRQMTYLRAPTGAALTGTKGGGSAPGESDEGTEETANTE
jgi:phage gp29-like protein